MQIKFTSLNSGSNGNCYYVGTEDEAVLIDAGISCRETEKRLKRLGLSIYKIKAIFVSHEHADHVKGIPVLAKKYNLPVYITPDTLRNARLRPENPLVHELASYETVEIGSLKITAFPKLHDARDPHSFVVECQGITVGIFTDCGAVCDNLVKYFKQCHAAFLESNYDEEMLRYSRYPYHLKQRISGGRGHLSNRQALNLFTAHKPEHMSHLLLAHLSKENNCPQLAGDLFRRHAGSTEVVVASRYEESPVFTLPHVPKPKVEQLELF
jgi:phosphoribosyl 1,2-cyclic phosphodiesterase